MVKDWKYKKIGDIAEIRMCKRIFAGQTKTSGDIPFFKIGTFGKKPDAFISQTLYDEYKGKYSFPNKGDILLSAAGTLGRTVVYDGKPAYFQDSNIVWLEIDKSQICNEYLSHYYQAILWASSEGSTISRLYNGIIRNTEITIPPLTEQKSIATILSDTDILIATLEKLIAKKYAIKQGAMQELLTGKRRLLGFSGEWVEVKLRNTGEIITGSTPPTSVNEYWNGNILWVTPTDITDKKDIINVERKISETGLSVIRTLPSNTLLVTCIASIGKNTILRTRGASNQQINAIIPYDEYDVDFLYYLVENNKILLEGKAGITATKIISKKEFAEIIFRLPVTKNEQIAIAAILSDMDTEIEALSIKLSKLKQIKQGMMQELLTGRIRLR